jgi:hypothetical protein
MKCVQGVVYIVAQLVSYRLHHIMNRLPCKMDVVDRLNCHRHLQVDFLIKLLLDAYEICHLANTDLLWTHYTATERIACGRCVLEAVGGFVIHARHLHGVLAQGL